MVMSPPKSLEDIPASADASANEHAETIGVSAGMGRESTAILSTVLALIVLSVVPKITRGT